MKDPSLVDHLQDCSRCVADARAMNLLTRILTAAGEDDTVDVKPFAMARQEAEARLDRKSNRESVHLRNRSDAARGGFWRPKRVAYGLVAFAALVAVTMIPFHYDKTIGYAVAFAGVERELVKDNELICDMLYDLGLLEAEIDLLGCDTTCAVQVLELRTLEEAQRVVNALARINNSELSSDIIPVREDASASLLERAGRNLL